MIARRGLFTVVVAVALALSGCGAPAEDRQPEPTATGATAAGVYDFTVAALDGATFDGQSLAGKPAVLWFWAPWCPTCLGQAKQVNALAAAYAGKATVLGVAGLGTVPEMHEFGRLAKLTGFTQLADEQGVVWKRFGMTAQSTFVVLDAEGAATARGHLDPAELPGRLDKLLVG